MAHITRIATSPMNFLRSAFFLLCSKTTKNLSKDTEWYKRIP